MDDTPFNLRVTWGLCLTYLLKFSTQLCVVDKVLLDHDELPHVRPCPVPDFTVHLVHPGWMGKGDHYMLQMLHVDNIFLPFLLHMYGYDIDKLTCYHCFPFVHN